MGEFTQSLLKLTEFPFSYSLIGLLAMIFGHGINLESFAKIGPLLILMGFVATTLSICDPVGAIQRLVIKGGRIYHFVTYMESLKNSMVFREELRNYFKAPYFFAIIYSPDDIKNAGYEVDEHSVQLPEHVPLKEPDWREYFWPDEPRMDEPRVHPRDIDQMGTLLDGLREQTVKTKWITAEIDRITALVYFMIVLSVFVVTAEYYPPFIDNFVQIFGNSYLTLLAILIFSNLALGAVSYMFVLRIIALRRKASIVFKFLTALEAIKTVKEDFKDALQNIERYLDNNDWTLAEYWVKRVQDEYTEIFLEKVKT